MPLFLGLQKCASRVLGRGCQKQTAAFNVKSSAYMQYINVLL